MQIAEIKEKAKELGIKAGKTKKEDLIKEIQRAEGNFDCFGTAVDGICDQADCCWKEDCVG